MNQQKIPLLNAQVLGQMLLMQSIVSNLPDEKAIFSFVCRGLLDIPGVVKVQHSDAVQETTDLSIVRFPLVVGSSKYGELWFKVFDPPAFAPYEDYLNNFCFTVAVILEERSQRRLNEQHQIELEHHIQERTQRLRQEIAERKQAEEQLKQALAEKETLLRELYHRTKNNMSVINALLQLQAAEIGDERLHAAFENTQNRIRSMALVHQKLYEAHDLSHINLKDYISELVSLLVASYQVPSGELAFVAEMEDVWVLIDSAIPCGLIVNELISNILEHAFPAGRGGAITARLGKMESGEIWLSIADDGVGVPPGFDFRKDGHLGLQNVFTLGETQLRGDVTFDANPGVACHLRFRDDMYNPRV
jgi:two-component sensor histidine kinase